MLGDLKLDAAPVLRGAPLVEALVEVEFPRAADFRSYGPIPGQMYERLRDPYSDAQDLEAVQLPFTFEAPIVRHRFSTPDGARLFQVGNGILSVNCLKYENYASFRQQVATVLDVALQLFGPPAKISQRYINKVDSRGKPIDQVLAATIQLPPGVPNDIVARQFSVTFADGDVGSLTVSCATPIDDTEGLVLLDLGSKKVDPPGELGALLEWMDSAHRSIETLFLTMLTPDFLEELK